MILISTVLFSFFLVKYLNAHTGIVLLRFPKKFYRLLWSALPFITGIETRGQKIPCFLNCLHVGGEENSTIHTFPITSSIKSVSYSRNDSNLSEVSDSVQQTAVTSDAPQV